MNRRTLLRRLGVAGTSIAALAGCSSPEGGSGTDAEPALDTETPTETPTETGTETETESGDGTETADGTDAGGGTGADGGSNAYEFLGVVQGWEGQAPSGIEGEQNPTLQLQAGQEYEVTWENGDGVPHDFTLQDANGNNLEQTELVSEQGASATLTFTATEEMAQYICTIHPNTMVGDIEVSA